MVPGQIVPEKKSSPVTPQDSAARDGDAERARKVLLNVPVAEAAAEAPEDTDRVAVRAAVAGPLSDEDTVGLREATVEALEDTDGLPVRAAVAGPLGDEKIVALGVATVD